MKTDLRDVRTLAEALRVGAYRPTHRLSDARRHLRAELAVLAVVLVPLNEQIADQDGTTSHNPRRVLPMSSD